MDNDEDEHIQPDYSNYFMLSLQLIFDCIVLLLTNVNVSLWIKAHAPRVNGNVNVNIVSITFLAPSANRPIQTQLCFKGPSRSPLVPRCAYQ